MTWQNSGQPAVNSILKYMRCELTRKQQILTPWSFTLTSVRHDSKYHAVAGSESWALNRIAGGGGGGGEVEQLKERALKLLLKQTWGPAYP